MASKGQQYKMTGKKRRRSKSKRSKQQSSTTWKRSWVFWALVALSVLVVGVGIWQLHENHKTVIAQSQPATPSKVVPAPDFQLMTSDGSTMHLSDLRGKVILLNFWATWCPPCKAVMPDLDAIHREYGPEHDFTVIGVNVGGNQAEVRAFAKQHAITFPLLLDTNGLITNSSYNIRSLPTSLIIDRPGNIRDAWIGQLTRKAMLARLEQVW